MEKSREQVAALLLPDYVAIMAQIAAFGVLRNEQDIFLARVSKHDSPENAGKFCWCTDVYESKEDLSSNALLCDYNKKVICVSLNTETADIYDAYKVEVEEIKPDGTFNDDGSLWRLPRYNVSKNPYVLSLADALELYHKYGLSQVKIEDIFIGAFSFKNFSAENMHLPEWQKHFGIGLCYMVDIVIDDEPSVAVICAFNEMRPKRVICNPLSKSVIRRFNLTDVFRTVCGRMRLVDGVMVHV